MQDFQDKAPTSTQVTKTPKGFEAVVFFEGRKHWIGYFKTEAEAFAAAHEFLRQRTKK